MSKPKLTYFPLAGRGEPIRLTFYIGGIDFEDHRLSFQDFGIKKGEGAFPYGSIPVLEVNGKDYAQSNALLRYAGKLAKLYPTDSVEALKVDELLDAVEDISPKFFSALTERDEQAKKEKVSQLVDTALPGWFGNVEKRLEKFGKGSHAVGDHLTIADLKIAAFFNGILNGTFSFVPAALLDKYPKVKGVITNTYSHPKVKEWTEKHK